MAFIEGCPHVRGSLYEGGSTVPEIVVYSSRTEINELPRIITDG